MNKILWITVFCLFCEFSNAQFYDRSWLVGNGYIAKLTFNNHYDSISTFHLNSDIVPASPGFSNISDTSGNILFYYNGSQVGNSLSGLMENGDTLTDSLFYNLFPTGFGESGTNLILPRSGNTFYLFYFSESDSLFAAQTTDEPDRLYYAIVDMNANGGLGKVVSKKNVAYKGLFGDCRFTACRHANGRDWWMVHQGEANNEYFVYLVTPDSVYPPQIQHIGPSDFYQDDAGAQAIFSPDGSKFATISTIGPMLLMDFDRCTGQFSNPDSISIPIDSFWYNGALQGIGGGGGASCCFSPSGRYLYTTNYFDIIQYDTWASNVMQTAITIGKWDSVGTGLTNNGFYAFYQMYLLPNGQIIVDDFQGGGNAFHLIVSPDSAGMASHFLFNGLPAPVDDANILPNMINYRLGALAGSACDTLTGITAIARNMKVQVYPNPGSDVVEVDVANRDLSEPIYFVLFDMLGQEILRSDIPLYQIQINRHNIAAGIYTWQIQNSAGEAKASGKLVWE